MKNTLRNVTLDQGATFTLPRRNAIAAANWAAGIDRDAIEFVTVKPSLWQRVIDWLMA